MQGESHHFERVSQAEVVYGLHYAVLDKLQSGIFHIIVEDDQAIQLKLR